jgi:hypothetical protein
MIPLIPFVLDRQLRHDRSREKIPPVFYHSLVRVPRSHPRKCKRKIGMVATEATGVTTAMITGHTTAGITGVTGATATVTGSG